MSTGTRRPARFGGETLSRNPVRAVALGGVALLMLSFFTVLYYFIDVTGNPIFLLVEAALTVGAATYFSESLRARMAAIVSVGLLGFGLFLYILSLPYRPPLLPLVTDAIALATGRSLLQLTNVDLWVLGVAPGPLFLTWYLGLRRRYVSATLAGGATLSFLVLTGDAGTLIALIGVAGGAVAVGVGDVDRRGDRLGAVEPLAVMLAFMILLSGVATVVPGGPTRTATGLSSYQAGGGTATVEASLVNAGNQIGIQGNISLSPEVRFRVESESESYWQVGSYDRYTGDGWIRTGDGRGYGGGDLDDPPSQGRAFTQRYTVIDELGVMPAAWKPVSMNGNAPDGARLTEEGNLDLDGTLSRNDTYVVESREPVSDPQTLREADTGVPQAISERYTDVPASTPDRFHERTARITANAENDYDTARVIERWLKNNKEYSLDVERPEGGNIADSFLFEMDAGYCTYFATTMVTMLRSQDIPARLAVGYTSGERVDRDEWVVRGFDAHAWVQAYFPSVGWVRFDPTPANPRSAAEQAQLEAAREENRTDVDTNDTGGPEWTPTATATPAPLTPPPERAGGGQRTITPPEITEPPGLVDGIRNSSNVTGTLGNMTAPEGAGESESGLTLPSREEATLIGFVIFGLVAGVRRMKLTGRVYRAIWVRYQPKADPPTDAERAFDRLEYVLEKRYRPRRPSETPRQYLADIGADERANAVARIRERARYAGEITREEADEAISLVDDLVSRRGA